MPGDQTWSEMLRILKEGVGPMGCVIIIILIAIIAWHDRIHRYTHTEKEKELKRAIADRNDWKQRLFEAMGLKPLTSSDDEKYSLEQRKPERITAPKKGTSTQQPAKEEI